MKKIKIMCTLAFGMFLQPGMAQSLPKWAGKARKAVFSVITYTKDNKILNTGNGFYIHENGIGVSDYALFKGADHAVVVTADGKEWPVECILGANDMYDVVKFKTASDKKVISLPMAANGAEKDEIVFLLPYSTQKTLDELHGKILKVDSIGKESLYYTIELKSNDKSVSCPLMNSKGEVLALMQKNSTSEIKEESYAIGVSYADKLNISALSFNDYTLNTIGIKKGLPEDESQALVYLYMASAQLIGEEYLTLLNEFITKYPTNIEGYIRRAAYYTTQGMAENYEKIEENTQKAVEVSTKKDEAYYQIAKLIYSTQLSLENKPAPDNWNLEKALAVINQAINIAQEPIYYQTQGDIYFAMQDYPAAVTAYEKVNKSGISSASSFYSEAKARELIEGADKREIIALLDSAIAMFSKPYGKEVAPYLYERARIKGDVEEYRGAVMDYNEFYQTMSGNVSAEFYMIREQAEMKCRMFQQALNDINKAVEMEPENADYWVEKGSVHLRINQPTEAVTALEKAVYLDPKQAPAYRMLGYTKIQLGNKDEGIRYLLHAKELGDEVATNLLDKYSK